MIGDLPIFSLGEAVLTEIDLPGEPDRAFVTATGFRFRAKLQMATAFVQRPVPNDVDGAVAPTCYCFSLSLAELNEDNSLKTLEGAYLIHDAHEITVTAEQLATQGWSVDEAVMADVRQQAAIAERLAGRRGSDMATLMADWGVGLSAPRSVLPLPAPAPSGEAM